MHNVQKTFNFRMPHPQLTQNTPSRFQSQLLDVNRFPLHWPSLNEPKIPGQTCGQVTKKAPILMSWNNFISHPVKPTKDYSNLLKSTTWTILFGRNYKNLIRKHTNLTLAINPRQTKELSKNPNFAELVKTLHRWVQLKHHLHNWEQTPKSIIVKTKLITDNIKLPCPDMQFSTTLNSLATHFNENLTKTCIDHLKSNLQKVEDRLITLSPIDLKKAISFAKKQILERSSSKIKGDLLDTLLQSAAILVGSLIADDVVETVHECAEIPPIPQFEDVGRRDSGSICAATSLGQLLGRESPPALEVNLLMSTSRPIVLGDLVNAQSSATVVIPSGKPPTFDIELLPFSTQQKDCELPPPTHGPQDVATPLTPVPNMSVITRGPIGLHGQISFQPPDTVPLSKNAKTLAFKLSQLNSKSRTPKRSTDEFLFDDIETDMVTSTPNKRRCLNDNPITPNLFQMEIDGDLPRDRLIDVEQDTLYISTVDSLPGNEPVLLSKSLRADTSTIVLQPDTAPPILRSISNHSIDSGSVFTDRAALVDAPIPPCPSVIVQTILPSSDDCIQPSLPVIDGLDDIHKKVQMPVNVNSGPIILNPTKERVLGGHNIHTSKKATAITILDTTKVLVVGDSNLRLCTNIPIDWQVECFPGINLNQLTNILNTTNKITPSLKHIIVQAGINDRENIKPDVEACLDAAKAPGVKVHYQGISVSTDCGTKLGSKILANINKINKTARNYIGQLYINPLPPMYVTNTGPGSIHYSPNTCGDIVEGMITALNHLN